MMGDNKDFGRSRWALTPRQYVVLRALADCAPTVRELAVLLGCCSTNAVMDKLKALQRKGYAIRSVPRLSRNWIVTEAGHRALVDAELESAGMEGT